jgi:glycosyltransferase involved in cell wall biosynthesis
MIFRTFSGIFPVQLILLILLSVNFSLSDAEEELQYVRFIDSDFQWQGELQTAIVNLRNSDGVQINLVAAVHLGEADYYNRLNEFFTTQDIVLYELVVEPDQVPGKDEQSGNSSSINFIQKAMANFLKLDFQLDKINYSLGNFLHADLTPSQLADLMASKNENFFTMFISLALAQAAEKSTSSASEPLSSFSVFSIIRALNADDQEDAFKYLFAQELGRNGGVISSAELEQQLTLLGDRNSAALQVLQEVLQHAEHQQISIFYGAAHMPGIEREITKNLGFNRVAVDWESAWLIP